MKKQPKIVADKRGDLWTNTRHANRLRRILKRVAREQRGHR